MTWLLHKLQRLLGLLTGRRTSSPVSDSTRLGSEIASRLQSSNTADSSDPVAIRVKGSSLEPAAPIQSTAPLRQKSSSVLKDTVDPVAAEPDTHQRLDAAPASLPGGTLSAPSFPTEVSDLISAPSSNLPVLEDNLLSNASVPSATSSAEDEHLPEIHDLLPAIEPDQHSDELTPDTQPATNEDLPSADRISSLGNVSSSNEPVVESAQRISGPEQATLFSFDIVETDAAVESDIAETNVAESDTTESDAIGCRENDITSDVSPDDISVAKTEPLVSDKIANLGDDPAVDGHTALQLPVVESLIPDTLLSDLSMQKSDEQTDVSSSDTASTSSASESVVETSSPDDVQNPWLTAVPAHQKKSVEAHLSERLTKNGKVKLLFKLKEGNFHGYIAPDDGTKDILFHQKYINAEIFDHIERGTQVAVTAKYMEGKAYATRVDLLQE